MSPSFDTFSIDPNHIVIGLHIYLMCFLLLNDRASSLAFNIQTKASFSKNTYCLRERMIEAEDSIN